VLRTSLISHHSIYTWILMKISRWIFLSFGLRQLHVLYAGYKILAKFQPNFVNFGNFGGGRKKNPKFCNTLIHVLYNFRLNFLLFILHIFVFNRCVVINHTNICLDLNVFFRKSILHVLVSKKISPKFRPNFAKFGSFGGCRNFCNTEIENPAKL